MANRRNFIKSGLVAGVATGMLPLLPEPSRAVALKHQKLKNWVWTNPNAADQESDLHTRYRQYYDAGIRGIFFEADSEKHYRAAKAQKLEAHRWFWTMNHGHPDLLAAHPEWYAVNRLGESCADKPPYVNYYRWLCPSKPQVLAHLQDEVKASLSKDYVDGIHLDYIRFCDVILPVNLWANYKIVQTSELPQYDYCYCQDCKQKFTEWSGGQQVDSIQYPEASLAWRLYRYHAITHIVNSLAETAKGAHKQITAAVFPTPEIARRNTRQDWTNWNLTGICPMIYHGFYKEPVRWIGQAVAEGVHFLSGRFPLYAGLYLPDFKDAAEVQQGIEYALQNGAAGISLFGDVKPDVLTALQQASAKFSGNVQLPATENT